jgi:hypothetical protein
LIAKKKSIDSKEKEILIEKEKVLIAKKEVTVTTSFNNDDKNISTNKKKQ